MSLKNTFKTAVIILFCAFPALRLHAVEEEVSKAAVSGITGEARLLALDWLDKSGYFISVRFTPGKKGRFLDTGTLDGVLADGRTVSMDIKEDFNEGTPDAILDHLRALQQRAEKLGLSPDEIRRQIGKKAAYRAQLEKASANEERKIHHLIYTKLSELMNSEFTSTERAIIHDYMKKIEPEIHARMLHEIEERYRKKMPDASAEKLKEEMEPETGSKLDKRVVDEMQRRLVHEEIDLDDQYIEARRLMRLFINKYKPIVEAQVRSEFEAKKKKKLERQRKIARGEEVEPEEPEVREELTLMQKLKKMVGLK